MQEGLHFFGRLLEICRVFLCTFMFLRSFAGISLENVLVFKDIFGIARDHDRGQGIPGVSWSMFRWFLVREGCSGISDMGVGLWGSRNYG